MTLIYSYKSAKSAGHLNLQKFLINLLPTAQMEVAFPSINRIADVVWREKKIIFEIQCSFLRLEEAEQRVKDYTSLGWKLVWILHEKYFNRTYVSPVEQFLRTQLCYFSDGFSVYDQFEVVRNRKRIFRSSPFPVDLLQPLPLPFSFSEMQKKMHFLQKKRLTFHFQGDFISYASTESAKKFIEKERAHSSSSSFLKKLGRELWYLWIGI